MRGGFAVMTMRRPSGISPSNSKIPKTHHGNRLLYGMHPDNGARLRELDIVCGIFGGYIFPESLAMKSFPKKKGVQMMSNPSVKFMSRREMLRVSATVAGGALVAGFYPAAVVRAGAAGFPQQAPADDQVAAMRAQFGAGFPSRRKNLPTTSPCCRGRAETW